MMKNVFKILQIGFFATLDLQTMKQRSFKYFWTSTQFHQELKTFLFLNISNSEIALSRKGYF